jgi:Uma2 family endonuclease
MRAASHKLTYADLAALPDDGLRHELIDGKHYVSPSPRVRHQVVLANLYSAVNAHVRAHGLGMVLFAPLDVVLSAHDVLVPDMLYVSRDRLALFEERSLHGAPDLVAEVLSPSTRRRDQTLKKARYQELGVAEYWLADPQQEAITVCRGPGDWRLHGTELRRGNRSHGTGQLTSPLFPGWALSLDEIFA